jgi:transcriptional/translational regulatory protein YebC/TACO1
LTRAASVLLGIALHADKPEGSTPMDATGAKFITDDVAAVSNWLAANGWTVITSEIGHLPETLAELTEEQQAEVGEFLNALHEHDDAHRVWAAVK